MAPKKVAPIRNSPISRQSNINAAITVFTIFLLALELNSLVFGHINTSVMMGIIMAERLKKKEIILTLVLG
jgi:hypothetical protein